MSKNLKPLIAERVLSSTRPIKIAATIAIASQTFENGCTAV